MLNNFKANNSEKKKTKINDYDDLFNLFISDFNNYGSELKKYTKKINFDNEIIYTSILKDKFLDNSIIILLDGVFSKIVINLSKGSNNTFNYNFEIKKTFNEKTKIHDIQNINITKTQDYNLLYLELYNYEKKNESFKIQGNTHFIIKKEIIGDKIENAFHISTENNIISYDQRSMNSDMNSENLLVAIENLLEEKNIEFIDDFKFMSNGNLKIKKLEYEFDKCEKVNKKLKKIELKMKNIMNDLFSENIMNTVFNIEDYEYKGNVFCNKKYPNISLNLNYDSKMDLLPMSFFINTDFYLYNLRDDEIFKSKKYFRIEDFINLDFSYYSFYDEELRYEVSDTDKTQSAFYNSHNQNDHVAEYNDLIKDIMIKYSINNTNLKDIVYPSGDIKDKFDLNILENDTNELVDLQKPFVKLKKNYVVQINKPALKKQVKNVN